MKPILNPIIITLVFAAALIGSAYFLKGNPAKSWVDSAIYAFGLIGLLRYFVTMPKRCSAKIQEK